MASAYLADDLFSAVRDSGMLPDSDPGGAQDTRLRAFLNREQRVYLMKLLLSVREEYRTATVDVAISSGEVAIPSRAVGAKLKLVQLVDDQGGVKTLVPLGGAGPAELDSRAGGVGGYYLRDNRIVLADSGASGTLRLHYPRRFNKIVAATAAREITAINTSTKVLTLASSIPGGFTTAVTYDLVKGTPHFDLLGSDLAVSAAAGTSMTFSATLPTDLAVGDYVALAGETPICQAPVELQDVLVQRVLVKYLKSQGDPKAADAKADLDELRDDALSLLSPRVENSAKPLLNYDAPGWRRWPFRRR